MKLDTLYKRTKTSAIQFWKVEVEDCGEHQAPIIIKTAGQIDTLSPTLHRETVHEGKQNRTPLQQAEAQAQSDWKRKHDEGYKSLNDLQIEKVSDHYGLKDTFSHYWRTLNEALSERLPQFNTDAAGELLPQLAKSKLWEPGCTTYPQLLEYKYDGNRTTIVIDPDRTFALSRTGKPQQNLDHLIAILNKNYPFTARGKERIIIDGEVYLHGLPLEEINEAIKKANANTPKLQFMAYDLPLLVQAQDIRSRAVGIFCKNIDSPFFIWSKPVFAHSDKDVIAFHDKAIELGYEGAMVKNPSALYQPGQRSSDWKKVKVWDDTEFEVVGYTLGQRGVQDLKFICKCKDGEFEATMNGTLASKAKLYNKIDSLIGKMLTVQHKGYTKYGIPNLSKGKLFRDE